MTVGQTENNEISSPQTHREKPIQELQTVLHSKKFQRIANVYRVLDMADKHAKNLFKYYPDGTVIAGDVKKAKVLEDDGFESKAIEASVLHLSHEQAIELKDETENGRDLIELARLFVGFYDRKHNGGGERESY